MREVEYEAHSIRVVVAALRNSCYGCSVAPRPFGVFVLRPRCSHATASRRHAERSRRRAGRLPSKRAGEMFSAGFSELVFLL